ncbi:MAG: restriction endonuclease subunit S [Gemmataceae bacterium]
MQTDQYPHRPLRVLCDLLNGFAFKPKDWSERGIPIIRIQNLNGGVEFNYYSKPTPSKYLIATNTLLFSWSGNRGTSFGPFVWNGPTGLLNQHIFKVTPFADIEPRWLYYALDLARRNAERDAHGGSGLVHVRRDDLLDYTVPCPDPHQQRRIADILDAADAAIRQTEAMIAKLRQMKDGLLHDLLTRGLDEQGRLRDPAAQPEQFKDSPLGRIPKGWTVKRLEELTTRIVDGIHHTPRYVQVGVPFLTVENLTSGSTIDFSCCRQVSLSDHNEFSRRANPTPGDVLVTKDGTLGVSRLVRTGMPEFSIFVSVAMIRPDQHRCRSELIHMFFESGNYEKQLGRLSAGTGLKHIHLEHFRAFLIATPTVDEQQRLIQRYEASTDQLRLEEAYCHKLKLQKRGLMHDLLTGRVRV